MMRPRTLLSLLAVVLAACASNPEPGPVVGGASSDVELAGVYQYQVVLNRGTGPGGSGAGTPEQVSGTIRIEEAGGSYTGEITGTGRSPMRITSVSIGRDDVTLQARGGDGSPVTLRLFFQGASFSGRWISEDGFEATVRGTRRG